MVLNGVNVKYKILTKERDYINHNRTYNYNELIFYNEQQSKLSIESLCDDTSTHSDITNDLYMQIEKREEIKIKITLSPALVIFTYLSLQSNDEELNYYEYWLRSKVKILVVSQVKSDIFKAWCLYIGTSSHARIHHTKSLLHIGFNKFLENKYLKKIICDKLKRKKKLNNNFKIISFRYKIVKKIHLLYYKSLNDNNVSNKNSLILVYDKIALFHTFQRFYHRVINKKKIKLINDLIIKNKLIMIMKKWLNSYNIQLIYDNKLEILVKLFIPKLRQIKLVNAIDKIKLNVNRNKECRAILAEMKSNIQLNKMALRSLYVFLKPLIVKGFLIFQAIYFNYGVKIESLRIAEKHYKEYLKFIGITRWFNRINIIKLYRNIYSKNKLNELDYKSKEIKTVKISILSRGLWKWKGYASNASIKIYFSLSDLISSQLKFTNNNSNKVRYKNINERKISIKNRNISSCQLLRSRTNKYANNATSNEFNTSKLSNFIAIDAGSIVPTSVCYYGGIVRYLSLYQSIIYSLKIFSFLSIIQEFLIKFFN